MKRSFQVICSVVLLSDVIAGGENRVTAQPLQAQVRMLTHNVFGLDEENCHQRAAGFGHIVAHATPAFDIVGLQEYYDNLFGVCPDSGILSDAIWCTGRYTNSDNYYRFYPEAFLRSGGIGIFSMGSICDFHSMEFTYQDTPDALQGTILARVLLPGTTVTVDVYVTHIHARFADDCDRCCRKGDLQELASFIATHSQRSGNPVIVMGDFNTGGPPTCCGNAGYDDIMEVLGSPRDVWYERNVCGIHRPLCGNNPDCNDDSTTPCNHAWCNDIFFDGCFPVWSSPTCTGTLQCMDPAPTFACPHPYWAGYTNDSCLNEMGDGQERIDFIFVMTNPAFTSSAFEVACLASQVVNWSAVIDPLPLCAGCPDPPPFIGHVSDHFGVEATIQILGESAVWVDDQATVQGTGTSCRPFTTVASGVSAVPAGNRVLVREGSYDETLTINRAMTVQAVGGMVTIGS